MVYGEALKREGAGNIGGIRSPMYLEPGMGVGKGG
jgi:hypothetical protein